MRTALLVPALLLVGCVDPPGPTTVAVCGPDELDDAGVCVPAPCGTGPWGNRVPLDDGPTWYVLADAEAPGEGTAERPYPLIASALEDASGAVGGRILIGAGTYRERLAFSRGQDGLELEGRCPELVTLDGEGLAAATISIYASQVVVRSLRVTGGRPGIIAGEVPGAPGLVLRGNDLLIEDNGGYGVLATGQGVLLDLAASTIRGVQATNEVAPGRGIGVEQGARFVGLGLRLEDIGGIGVAVEPDAEAELEDVSIAPSGPSLDGSPGRGVRVRGGELVLRRGLVEAQPDRGARVEGGGSLELEDVEVTGLPGLDVIEGSAASVLRCAIEGGARVAGANSALELTSSAVEGSPGILVTSGATLRAENATVAGTDRGVHVAGAGSGAILTDVDVTGIGGGATAGEPGVGVLVTDDAVLEADDLAVVDCAGPGLLVARGGDGRCVACRLEGNGFAGAWSDGGSLRLEGGTVRGGAEHPEHGGGVGVGGVGGGLLQVDDTLVSSHPHAGVVVRGAGTFRFASIIIEEAGLASAAPGLLARDGTGYWQGPGGPGLFVFDTTFRQLANDAMLFDAATGTVSGSSFSGVGQLELYTQNCAGVAAPDVAEALSGNDCSGPERPLGEPLLWPAPPAP